MTTQRITEHTLRLMAIRAGLVLRMEIPSRKYWLALSSDAATPISERMSAKETYFWMEGYERALVNSVFQKITPVVRNTYAAAAATLGSMTSERKAASSRENGKKGGRPKRN